jgi:hypothetical protein
VAFVLPETAAKTILIRLGNIHRKAHPVHRQKDKGQRARDKRRLKAGRGSAAKQQPRLPSFHALRLAKEAQLAHQPFLGHVLRTANLVDLQQ